MKKTLMVLSFALCATFAFAQTKTSANRESQLPMKATFTTTEVQGDQQSGYKGSIFTKVGELMTCDFSVANSGYTTGTATSSDMVGGQNIPAHGQSAAYHSQWRRIADTTSATVSNLRTQGYYPRTFGTNSGFVSLHGFDSETPMSGIMLMTMQDQSANSGGSGTVGDFDAYIAFDPFTTVGAAVVDVKFYQYYRCFNRDQNFIDYSTNGTTWNTVEINARGVDMEVNDGTLGWLTTTMPTAIGNQANVYLRIRWSSTSNVGGVYGYFWFLDDVKAVTAPTNRFKVISDKYFEGFYGLMPKDMQLPMVWACEFANTGISAQTNVQGRVYTTSVGGSTFTQAVATNTLSNVAANPVDKRVLAVDPLGWYDDTATYHGWSYEANGNGTANVSLATGSLGVGQVYSDLTSTAINHVIRDSFTFDTVAYTVTKGNGDANSANYGRDNEGRVWGRDNGILRKFSRWVLGMTSDGYVSEDPEEIGWSDAGYCTWISYVTGNNIPAGWVIRGMEIVPSSYPGMAEAGAKIEASILRDSAYGGSVSFKVVETGAGVHTVAANELNNTTNLEYLTNGQYNTVYIPFPEQPELLANTSYRVGYEIAEDGSFFTPATAGTFYYNLSDSSVVRFDTTPGMHQYRHMFTVSNPYTLMIYDPRDGGTNPGIHFLGNFVTGWPMMRLVVGPAQTIPTYTISFQCDGDGQYGYIMDNRYTILCGGTESAAEGSQHTYIIMPEEGYEIDKVYLDGQEIAYDLREGDEGDYGVYTLSNITANHTLRASFLAANPRPEGISTVNDCVKMKLQPNPATSNVRLTISGVSGMVDFALIDMSGRVITSSKVNAESAQVIDLSNVAKGAYFVRITNNNISKVEKLIVR